ncbi:uncharacterized protein LOC143556259 [Bidens hawaiensis]|uniref:uncharacterized protein LOC143556259 n=1 Tax=Bidens hawaiensis TaxID=980011 RepID=UPI0040497D0D
MTDREVTIKLLRATLLKAQNRMKQQADKHKSGREFVIGSWAYLKLQPYMQNTGRFHKHSKLTLKYFGPYLILEKIGMVSYKLDLQSDVKIHPVFHESLLKPAVGPPTTVVPVPADSWFHLLPEAIIDRRMV